MRFAVNNFINSLKFVGMFYTLLIINLLRILQRIDRKCYEQGGGEFGIGRQGWLVVCLFSLPCGTFSTALRAAGASLPRPAATPSGRRGMVPWPVISPVNRFITLHRSFITLHRSLSSCADINEQQLHHSVWLPTSSENNTHLRNPRPYGNATLFPAKRNLRPARAGVKRKHSKLARAGTNVSAMITRSSGTSASQGQEETQKRRSPPATPLTSNY